MSAGEKFRVVTPVLSIMSSDGYRIPVMVPKNAIIEVVTGLLNHERMVDMRWDGHVVMMFAQDVRERCEQVKGPG